MVLDLLAITGGCVLLYFGGNRLLDSAVAIGQALAWPATIIGLVVVSLGTSAPELFVSAGSALQGYGDIAAGNVVGSNSVNIALVLGLAALLAVLKVDQTLRLVQFPLMVLSAGVAAVLLADGYFGRLDALIVIALLAASMAIAFRSHRNPEDAIPQATATSNWRNVVGLLVGVAMLVAGAELLILGAVALSRDLGVSEAAIALSVTAFGTSLPEIAATVLAVSRRQTDLAVGNVVGSNIMNVGLVLGMAGLLAPFESEGITGFSLATMFVFCALAAVLAMVFGRFSRWAGALFLTGYVAYLWVLFS